jgi:hypothetical protein
MGRVARRSVFSPPVSELWVPRSCVLGKGGHEAACTMKFIMPSGLHRTYGAHHLHFITCSCYRRLPFLGSAHSRVAWLRRCRRSWYPPFAKSAKDGAPFASVMPTRSKARATRQPITASNYCFSFSQNVNGLTNRTTCPGCGETVALPHVFAEAYP